MRIGIIGLGGIAQKAYLPVIGVRKGVELIFCTRNQSTLKQLVQKYRPEASVNTVEELLAHQIDAAFVHSATESHPQIIEQLFCAGVPVYADKPIAYHYEDSVRLVELAEELGVMLMIGFNRRFAPMVADLKSKPDRRMILLQKHRLRSPDIARRVIMDDFIHVVDTLRFLLPDQVRHSEISVLQLDGLLCQVSLQLQGDGFTGIGMMNRDSGFNEERLEIISPSNKWVVNQLNETLWMKDGKEHRQGFSDWDTVLYRRGFEPIIEHFLTCVQQGSAPSITARDALESHLLCEEIIRCAEAKGAKELTS
ncbi:gfo/Idh/MocA family oxidoreductase [Paenibacillus sp. CAA11]|nr:gfo/Idh/MocA family oxidoreductase [Paenibacillus sp. CAA11]